MEVVILWNVRGAQFTARGAMRCTMLEVGLCAAYAARKPHGRWICAILIDIGSFGLALAWQSWAEPCHLQ